MPEQDDNLNPDPARVRRDIALRSGHDEAAAGDSTLPRILLLIDKRGNRDQVARQLRRHGELLIPDSGALPEQGFDLAIVDGAGLRRWHHELTLARQDEMPVFLPVMLILSRAELRHQAKKNRDTIDEFIITPIDTEEFLERTSMLLRARRLAEQQRQDLVYTINHDRTTGLPARELFLRHLETAIQRADTRLEKLYVVAGRIPMERFTQGLGQSVTEDIIEAVVSDLQEGLGVNFVMSRFDREQGATLLPAGSSLNDATRFSQRLIQTIQCPRLIRGEWIRPVARVGIAIYPDDAKDASGLLEAASTAMNDASPTGVPHFYSPALQDRTLYFLRIESEMHRALEQQEFELWFQPKFRLSDLTMAGAEALIRWRKPSGEMVSPGVFIPIAENAGLIQRIDNWVIEAACAAMARWRKSGLDCPRIAVNITPQDLAADGFVPWLTQLISEYGLTPSCIGIEMTETMLMDVDQNIQDSLKALRDYGIRVSIDDFGTGYSSLSYLQQLPADILKIDKSFIDHVPNNGGGQLITNAIIALGEQFGLELVAEGIETREQLEYLRKRGVQTGQGYLVSRPLPEPAFIEAMKNGLSISQASEAPHEMKKLG
ncbi:putative bifunctional diguanylate cyclase/phosphodiesterase [Halomonas daqiaonensis]|uniref:EAL domain, c-di-GMP-specific phosphodiesterase class I (Or its enzymatically inactive variant) n=1 Tax=Halomonas daqiaonensis TaxID=650850 RepID=A0A1H7TFB9_9GAMM|nr:GGDEF domain-containing phosphodiesterase [Halomonas daqiaonensis]SEL83572.1 EAL domain, c-di-GMP-specific phosphodiesterase class I (or its enzymatically inactive variant) [Halomonas daqiaonensis]